MPRSIRPKLAAVTTGLLSAAGLALGIGAATPASAATPSTVCTSGQCINLTLGKVANGTALQFWDNVTGKANNRWVANAIGTVKAGEGGVLWPFTDGSGLNTRYDGATVYQFNFYASQGFCMDQSAFNSSSGNGGLQLKNCASTTAQDFVLSPSGFLVAAGASDGLYSSSKKSNNPVWVTDLSRTGNGGLVWLDEDANLVWHIS